VNDLLTMSRLDGGVLSIDMQPLDLESIVNEAVQAVLVAGAERRFDLSIAPAGVRVRADARRIQEVLYNLVDNALKYSPSGTPIRVCSEAAGPDMVQVCVCDRGPGVPPEELDAIFARFHHAEDRRMAPGAGLGLAICKSIVEAHGGRMWAELPAGGGLEVKFTLPIAPEPETRESATQ
jgi:signal transduction histidine kinase